MSNAETCPNSNERRDGFRPSPSGALCVPQQVRDSSPLLTIPEAAALLSVSESWVRRHSSELPVVRVGRLIRLDSALLLRKIQGRLSPGNRLKTEREKSMSLQVQRYQRGSVYKTGKRIKVWYGMWREDVQQPDGKTVRRQRNIRLGTIAELPTRSAAYEALSRQMGLSRRPSVAMKVSELCQRWQVAVVPTLKNTTAAHYQNALRAYIVPAFGQWEITSLGRYDVETFLGEQAKKYSRNTLRSMRVSLSLLFSWAISCGWIEKNPCAGVKLPRCGKRIVRTVLSPEQVTAIAKKLDEPYATLVLFLAVTGLRIGEAIAIKWSDFETDVLHICRRIYQGEEDTTKTQKSDRSLPIPQVLLSRMRLLGAGTWIFRSRDGTPVNPGNSLRRYIRPAARELGIAIGGWHDFRHTVTTGLLRNGVSPKVVSNILGHSDVQTTLNVYDHPTIENFRAPLEGVANRLL